MSSVTGMSHMFCIDLSFNGDISKWDVSRVTDMRDNHGLRAASWQFI